jgi:hypothetical protein
MTHWIDVDGEPVNALEVTWIHYAPCGCVCGLSLAQLPPMRAGDPGMKPRLTLDDVEEDTPGIVRLHEAAQGFRWKPVRRGEVSAADLMRPCPHDPQFGIAPDPTMPGMVWATTDTVLARGRRTHRRHLIPADRGQIEFPTDPEDRKAADRARWGREGDTVAACRKKTDSSTLWKVDHLTETVPCRRCVATAEAAVQVETVAS